MDAWRMLESAGATDVGRRSHNEDAYLIDRETGLILVADGVGGHHAGEIASRITTETIDQQILAGADLDRAVRAANRAVMAAVHDGRGKMGMASTVVAARILDGHFDLAWVGDSRAYLWDGSLKLLTRDHSLVERLLSSGEIKPEEVASHPQRNVIVQAIGLQSEDDLRVDRNSGSLQEGDILLLCSDGMSDVLDNRNIAEILSEDGSLEERCKRLVEQSIARGGRDNSTVILVEGQQGLSVTANVPDIVWRFDPATGETSGLLEVAPVALARSQHGVTNSSPQTTQMLSISEIEKSLAERSTVVSDADQSGPERSKGMSKWLLGAVGLILILIGALSLTGCDQAKLGYARLAGLPTDSNVLFWTPSQRDKAFPQMEKLTPTRTIAAGTSPRPLTEGEPLQLQWLPETKAGSIEDYLANQNAAGVMVVHDGRIRLEAYSADYSREGRWTSFSVAKSLTSTLVGAAIQDGYIQSLEAPLTDYIPGLAGSGYDGVTVQQLLTMQSGVRWNEDYDDPESDVALFNQVTPKEGEDPIVTYMRTLEREFEPGTHWRYNTGETNLIGVLVRNATGKPLAEYLSEKVWIPYGMHADGAWIVNEGGTEIGGCCISARLSDYALFGQFALHGGRAGKAQVVPVGWFGEAGHKQADIGRPGQGYGFQWWTYDDGSFAAQGIFGQGIFIDPARRLVIASNSNWDTATSEAMSAQRQGFYRSVQNAIDAERAQ